MSERVSDAQILRYRAEAPAEWQAIIDDLLSCRKERDASDQALLWSFVKVKLPKGVMAPRRVRRAVNACVKRIVAAARAAAKDGV